jgi:hypothetical protein
MTDSHPLFSSFLLERLCNCVHSLKLEDLVKKSSGVTKTTEQKLAETDVGDAFIGTSLQQGIHGDDILRVVVINSFQRPEFPLAGVFSCNEV